MIPNRNLELLAEYNPWWQTHKVHPELLGDVKRPQQEMIYQHLATQRQILLLEGPRRVGKTTLMYQAIHQLLVGGTPPETIVFIKMDDPYLNLETVFLDLEKYLTRHVIRGSLATLAKPIYLFLDEITVLPDWELYLKRYYDLAYPLRFICSSSAAALFRAGSRESLAGRATTIEVYPFSFSEVLALRDLGESGIEVQRKIPLLWREFYQDCNLLTLYQNLKTVWDDHFLNWQDDLPIRLYLLEGGFPEYIRATNPRYKGSYFVESVVERVLFHDVGPLVGATDLSLLERLFLYVNNQSGSEIRITEASRNLGAPHSTLSNYLRYLTASGLLYTLPKFAPSVKTQMRSLERVYAIDPGLYVSLARLTPAKIESSGKWGTLAEMAVFAQLKRQGIRHLWYWREREAEVDFIFELGSELVAVEVKYRTDPLARRNLRGLRQFQDRFHPRYKIIVSKELLARPDEETLVVPLSLFLE